MDLTPPQHPPSIAPTAEPTDDLGRARELRQLRARVAQLETEKAELQHQVKPSVSTIESHEEKKHRIGTCGFHPQVLVSMETNSVVCAVCDAELAPLDVLREFAREERRFVQSLNGLRDEKQLLHKQVDKLKKQVQALEGKVRKKAGYDPSEYKGEAERYSARAFYNLVGELTETKKRLEEATK